MSWVEYKGLVTKVQMVFDMFDPPGPQREESCFLEFDWRKRGRYRLVWMGASYTGQDDSDAFTYAPKDFKAPFYFLEDFLTENSKMRLLTTPYGWLPTWVIGGDNKLYSFDNIYFLDSNRSVKRENVICSSDGYNPIGLLTDDDPEKNLEAVLREIGFRRDELPQLAIVPREEDSRDVDWVPGDYEKIETILYLIEKNVLIELNSDLSSNSNPGLSS